MLLGTADFVQQQLKAVCWSLVVFLSVSQWCLRMVCAMSIRMGIVSSVIRIRCGIMSMAGTGIGYLKKTGRSAVKSGIAGSRLDRCGFVRVVMSLVASRAIRNVVNRANSM